MPQGSSLEAETAAPELTVSRVIDASQALVFAAWTDPRQVARWWGPQGFVTTHCDMDIRPGGAYRVCMRSPAGTDHWKVGVYREIAAPERIVFTFAWADAAGTPGHQTLVTVTFEALGGKTRLTLHQSGFESRERRDDHIQGWTSCLQRFADVMAVRS
jgi:uncharacterized protein YndB with AHSA1/START domain